MNTKERKDAWRRDRYRGLCVDCGAPTYGTHTRIPERCKRCGPLHRRVWSAASVAEAIRAVAGEIGTTPAAHEWTDLARGRPDLPSAGTIRNHLGSWAKAIRAAGLEPRCTLRYSTNGSKDAYGRSRSMVTGGRKDVRGVFHIPFRR